MDVLVLIPVLSLVLLSSLRFEKAERRGFVCLWAVIGVILASLLVRVALPDEVLFASSEVARRVRAQIADLRKTTDWQKKDIVVIEGSSVTAFGCDNQAVEARLIEAGWNAKVLQFSAQGANHFERTFFLEAFLRGLEDSEREALAQCNVLLLREVFDAYDKEPLFLFAKESYAERAKVYMSPPYAWAAWNAFQASLPNDLPFAGRINRSLETLNALMEKTLMNLFGVGSFADMNRKSIKKKTGSFFALDGSKTGFDYKATVRNLNDIDGIVSVPAGWKTASLFQKARTDPYFDQTGFFSIPLLESHRRKYQTGFTEALPEEILRIGPLSTTQLEPFLRKENWFDGAHLTGIGAAYFSRWFADQLVEWRRNH